MSKDKNYLLISQDSIRKLVEIPVEGRIEAIGFTRYSVLGGGSDGITTYETDPQANGSYPVISHEVFNELYGKVLTIVDATFQEGSQKEAFKSLLKNEMSGWYDKNTNYTLKMTEQAYKYLEPVSKSDYIIEKDGDKWFCADKNFVNLQESDAAFGDTPQEALQRFISNQ